MVNERVAEKRETVFKAPGGGASVGGTLDGGASKAETTDVRTLGAKKPGGGSSCGAAPDGETWKTCMVCDQPKKEGITVASGFFICASCENEMVNTSVEDEKYPFFVRRLKPLWLHIDP